MAEKSLLLQILDQTWKEHLLALDHLRQGINLRAYAQRDPLNEYKREAFELFEGMLVALREQVTCVLCHVELRMEPPPMPEPPQFVEGGRRRPSRIDGDGAVPGLRAPTPLAPRPPRAADGTVHQARAPGDPGGNPRAPWAGTGRNALCPAARGRNTSIATAACEPCWADQPANGEGDFAAESLQEQQIWTRIAFRYQAVDGNN